MHVINATADLGAISDVELQQYVRQRLEDMVDGEEFDPDSIVVSMVRSVSLKRKLNWCT